MTCQPLRAVPLRLREPALGSIAAQQCQLLSVWLFRGHVSTWGCLLKPAHSHSIEDTPLMGNFCSGTPHPPARGFARTMLQSKALSTQSVFFSPLSQVSDLHHGQKISLPTSVLSLSSTNISLNKSLACLNPF